MADEIHGKDPNARGGATICGVKFHGAKVTSDPAQVTCSACSGKK